MVDGIRKPDRSAAGRRISRAGRSRALIAAAALALLAPGAASAKVLAQGQGGREALQGTIVLGGTMTSAATMTMTGAFSVGQAASLDWNLPRPVTVQLNGYTQRVRSLRYSFTSPPDSYRDIVQDGHPQREFHWSHPPTNTVIRVSMQLQATVTSRLNRFRSRARYPLTRLPARTAPFTRMTGLLRLPASADALVLRLRAQRHREQGLVNAVANWVATHVSYGDVIAPDGYSASFVFARRVATCRGYDDIMAGLLRRLGIPAQVEYGWVSAAPVNLPGPQHGRSSIRWSIPGSEGDLHTWLNIWFPDAGWVPFDPQNEKFFIDVRHVALYSNVDAGDPHMGKWSASYFRGTSPTGRRLSDGNIEVIPADGISSRVTIRTRDDFHISLRRFTHDVNHMVLFAR